jgi:lipopolysaccharide transport system ATP-binding protein
LKDSVIAVEGLSKRYMIGRQREKGEGLRHAIERAVRSPVRWLRSGLKSTRAVAEEFWALRDVNLEVAQGEVLGIIGQNGAGKSTLLKILSRITEPTEGRVRLKGRTASLLEVGTGFHPELTGRENIFLNGAILGMTRAEIKTKFDAIVAFAEIDQFLDTPVKRYSSGMYVRLAFAVAAHLEPEILIVDEVLAVGDAQFQKKCLGKLQDVSRQQGRTVLFVSHNMQAVSTMTTRCLLLRNGRTVLEGPPATVIAGYLQNGCSGEQMFSAPPSSTAPSITRIEVETSEPNNTHIHGRRVRFVFDVTVPVAMPSGVFSFQVFDARMQPVLHMWVFDREKPFCRAPGSYRLTCDIPRLRLYLGRYSITAHLSDGYRGGYFQTIENVCPFEVVMHGHERDWAWEEGTCLYLEDGRWHVTADRAEAFAASFPEESSLSI